MIFVDSDVYLALNLNEDANKEKAIRLTKSIAFAQESKVTSWEVIDEVTTKLSYYGSRKRANEFIRKIFSSDTLIKFVDETMVGDSISLFVKQTSKKVSMTDCANMVIAQNLGITTFFSFDHHYEQNGFTLLKDK